MKRIAIDHARSVSPAITALALATLAFVLLPLPFIVLYALSMNNYTLFSAHGFTLQWFQRFF
jgi:ABC-type spermidine/putrescine transport system permease subunit II